MSNLIVREMKLVKENQIIHSNVYVIKDCKNREDLALVSLSFESFFYSETVRKC